MLPFRTEGVGTNKRIPSRHPNRGAVLCPVQEQQIRENGGQRSRPAASAPPLDGCRPTHRPGRGSHSSAARCRHTGGNHQRREAAAQVHVVDRRRVPSRAEPSVQKSAGKYSARHWRRKYYDGHGDWESWLPPRALVWRPRPLRARLLLTEP